MASNCTCPTCQALVVLRRAFVDEESDREKRLQRVALLVLAATDGAARGMDVARKYAEQIDALYRDEPSR